MKTVCESVEGEFVLVTEHTVKRTIKGGARCIVL
jgi:hypothetical protein